MKLLDWIKFLKFAQNNLNTNNINIDESGVGKMTAGHGYNGTVIIITEEMRNNTEFLFPTDRIIFISDEKVDSGSGANDWLTMTLGAVRLPTFDSLNYLQPYLVKYANDAWSRTGYSFDLASYDLKNNEPYAPGHFHNLIVIGGEKQTEHFNGKI